MSPRNGRWEWWGQHRPGPLQALEEVVWSP